VLSVPLIDRQSRLRLPVLLYHNVGRPRCTAFRQLIVAPDTFRRQMLWLKRWGVTPIVPDDWYACCQQARLLPERPVMITFDDAYAELAEFAFPVLQKFAFRATVFVPTAKIAGTNDWDRGRGAPIMGLLSAEDIRYWHSRGISFGAHSRHHADLTKVDDSTLADEVIGSSRELSSLLGEEVHAFAYPWGQYNEAVEKLVRDTFQMAFTTEEGMNHPGTSPYRICRTMVQAHDGRFALFCRLRLGYYPVQNWRDRTQLRTRLRTALRLPA
jgi:peptidoglycan/xylan/chitin deacetylase (PgdA/CDA1 family)